MRALGAHVSARTDAEAAASEYAAAFADRLLVVDGRRRRPNQRLERHRPRRHRTHRRNPHAQHLPEAQNPRQRRPPPPRHPSSPTSAAEHTRPARNARVRAPAADNAIRLRAVASQATEATILISHLVLCRGRRSDGSAGQVLGSRSSQSRRLGDLALGPTSAVTAGTPVAHHAGPPAGESGSEVLVSDFVLLDVGLEGVGDGGQGAGLCLPVIDSATEPGSTNVAHRFGWGTPPPGTFSETRRTPRAHPGTPPSPRSRTARPTRRLRRRGAPDEGGRRADGPHAAGVPRRDLEALRSGTTTTRPPTPDCGARSSRRDEDHREPRGRYAVAVTHTRAGSAPPPFFLAANAPSCSADGCALRPAAGWDPSGEAIGQRRAARDPYAVPGHLRTPAAAGGEMNMRVAVDPTAPATSTLPLMFSALKMLTVSMHSIIDLPSGDLRAASPSPSAGLAGSPRGHGTSRRGLPRR
jgi:hypothetical protein